MLLLFRSARYAGGSSRRHLRQLGNYKSQGVAASRNTHATVMASLLSCHGGSFLSAEQKSELEEVAELIGQPGKVK